MRSFRRLPGCLPAGDDEHTQSALASPCFALDSVTVRMPSGDRRGWQGRDGIHPSVATSTVMIFFLSFLVAVDQAADLAMFRI